MKYLIFPRQFLLTALALIALVAPTSAQLLDPSKPAAGIAPAVTSSPVIKSELDTRDYRYLTLSNQLKVLLVSDAKAEQSTAALTIAIGSRQDPESRPGLAQLVEHLLIVASEKYPEARGYQQYIQQQGGSKLGLTIADRSQYAFAIDHAFLEPALDRFAGSFIAPLFPVSALEEERSTLNAEYLAALNDPQLRGDPGAREWDVYRSLFNPAHPAAKFPGGNLETLADRENHGIRDDLLNFYKENYSANLMTLALVSNQSLDSLQKMVEARFALVPNHNKRVEGPSAALLRDAVLPASVNIQSATELRQLSLTFLVPNLAVDYQTKPWAYIAHLLRGGATGSLLSMLKNLGWAESIAVTEFPASQQENFFQISLQLTAKGAKTKEQIVSAVFEYFKIIALHGISDWRFGELKQVAENEFRFQERNSSLQGTVELARAMQDYPARDVLRGRYSFSLYDEALIRRALGYLRKDNVIVTWAAPEVQATAVSQYYQVPFNATSGIAEVAELKPLYRQKLSLPERNLFIAKNTSVKVPSMRLAQGDVATKNIPSLLFSNDQFNLWFLQDQYYRSPKAELNFRVILPMLNNSLENAARNQLFVALTMDKLNEYTYPANFAGLSFAVSANARGFDMRISGYTNRQSLLVNRIVEVMAQASFSQERFDAVKERLIRAGLNEDSDSASTILVRKISRLQYLPDWDMKEYAGVLQKTSFSTFKSFTNELLRDAKIDSLFYGNLYPQDAIKLAALVDHQLLKKKGSRVLQSAKGLRTDNRSGKSWLYSYPAASEQRALVLYVPALSPTIGAAAHSLLLNEILQPTFAQKREGRGDSQAELLTVPLKNLQSSVLVLQSPSAIGEQMLGSINDFLLEAPAIIAENFPQAKNALLQQLRTVPGSLSLQSEKFWQSILLGDITFSRQQELISAIAAISPEASQDYYRKTFLQKNRRLWLANFEIESSKDFDRIGNIAEYQQKQQAYLYP